jgi:hypothetical protein
LSGDDDEVVVVVVGVVVDDEVLALRSRLRRLESGKRSRPVAVAVVGELVVLPSLSASVSIFSCCHRSGLERWANLEAKSQSKVYNSKVDPHYPIEE